MLSAITEKRADLADLCRRHGVKRLDVFGSAARGADFDHAFSDIDFLVELAPPARSLASFLDLQEALEALFHRPVDLVSRRAAEASRNDLRRRAILDGARTVCGA